MKNGNKILEFNNTEQEFNKMKQTLINTMAVTLMILGFLSLINVKTVTPREIASIYTDLHGGRQ